MSRTKLRPLLLVAAGALQIPAFAPLEWFPLAWLSLAIWLICLYGSNSSKRGFAYGYAYGVGLFGAGVWWVYVSIHDFGGAAPPLAAGFAALLVAYLALFPALVSWGLQKFARRKLTLWWTLLPALWLLGEVARAWILTGFPWLTLGYSQLPSWASGLYPVLGVYGASLLTLWTALLLAHGWLYRGRKLIKPAIWLGLMWGGCWILTQQVWTTPSQKTIDVAMVQGNISQDKKWNPKQFWPTLKLYEKATLANQHADVVIWPEVAVPGAFKRLEHSFFKPLQQQLASTNTQLLTGILREDPAQAGFYMNSAILLDQTTQHQFYNKYHLVPFGEYFPVPDLIRDWLKVLNLPYSDMSAGQLQQPLIEAAGLKLGMSICYEDVFGAETAIATADADLIVNISNDAWFGDTWAPAQHQQMAQARALELGRYLLRATNTGITAVIDHNGQVLKRIPQFETNTLNATVPAYQGNTPYRQWRDWPMLIIVLLLLTISVYQLNQKRR